jgi:polygalacturonase
MKKKFLFLFLLIGFQAIAEEVNIVNFGAKGDGKTINTAAIQKAIDVCSANGGGRVLIPVGEFLCGQLTFRSDIELHVAAGATLKGSSLMNDYPDNSFLIARGCRNIIISGMGTIDGNGTFFYDSAFQPLTRPQPFILFDSCRYIKLRDFKIVNSPSHGFRIFNCAEVTVDGIYMDFAERSPNTDGIDIVDTRNVYISNSTLITGDDAICLKSHAAKVENVTVVNCYIQSDDGGIKLGTGSADTIQYCTFSNLVIRKTRFALALFMQEGGVYRYINFNNIQIQNGGRQKNVYPIYVDVDKKTQEGKLGLIEHVNFSNLQIETRGNILISGQPGSPLKNITLSHITMRVSPCDNLSAYKKPRGNRKLPVFSDTRDLSSAPAHITLGFIQNLRMYEIRIIEECADNRRKKFYKVKVSEIK